MSKGVIFFCCSCAILVFTIINLSVGPIISGVVGYDSRIGRWGTANCEYYADEYDKEKDKKRKSDDELKYGEEWKLNECKNKKSMHDMEYTSFIFNAIIGFVCGLLGLLHLLDLKKEFVPKTGLIGLGCGIVGFIFSFIYVALNGIVYTTYYDETIIKRDSDGVFAEKKTSGYECIYFDSNENKHALRAKYNDLIQKQYNYDKDLVESYTNGKASGCIHYDISDCNPDGYIEFTTVGGSTCDKLYAPYTQNIGITNKDKSDRFLTTLLLSLFLCLSNIGLAIFGFLLYRTPSEF